MYTNRFVHSQIGRENRGVTFATGYPNRLSAINVVQLILSHCAFLEILLTTCATADPSLVGDDKLISSCCLE